MKPFTPAKIKADLIFALSVAAVFGFSVPQGTSIALLGAAGLIAAAVNFGEALVERADPKFVASWRHLEPALGKAFPSVEGATLKRYKTGRRPAVRPPALEDFAEYATAPLPSLPREVKPPAVSYPMDGNATYGDCTIAGCDHLVRAWNAEAGEHDHLPTETEIVSEYFRLTGGEDTGLVEAEVLKTWHGEGLHLFGGQIAGYAPINKGLAMGVRTGVYQAIAFYGGVYLGVNVGMPQQEQFQRGEPWRWVKGQEEDGHCVVGVGYLPNGSLLCATWGGLATLTIDYLDYGLEEAWAVLSHQMVEAKGDQLGVDLAALTADLAKV